MLSDFLEFSVSHYGEFITNSLPAYRASNIRFISLVQFCQIDIKTRCPRKSIKDQCVIFRSIHSPPAACATARNNARPLFIVSSHSAAGSES